MPVKRKTYAELTCRVLLFICQSICVKGISPLPAPLPSSESSYAINDYPWETRWTDAEKAAQRVAGAELIQNLTLALQSNASSFSIPPGTYRTSEALGVSETTSFTLHGEGAELIAENFTLNINVLSNSNFSVVGPMTLDADPFGFTQGIIIDTDNQSTFTVQMMPGYVAPTDVGTRMMFYDPEGNLFPMYQVTVEAITNVSTTDVYQITPPADFWTTFVDARRNATQLGNLVSFEGDYLNGGINTNGNDGIKFSEVSVHANCLIYGTNETGPVILDKIHGIRRPGTDRLNAGGHVAFGIAGGSFHMSNSEVSYHFDDLSDIQSGLAYAFAQVSPTSVYAGFRTAPAVGTTLVFYDLATLEDNGKANITSIEAVDDQNIINNFQNGLSELQLLDWDIVPVLIELDSEVNMTNSYALLDAIQTRPSSMVFENCYFHDGLAAGIIAKGANEVLIRNNTVARSGYTATAVGFDPYWWEGGVPANVMIEDNYVVDVPYSQNMQGRPPVSTYVDSSAVLLALATATPMHNVTIRGNTIVNPKIAGIGVAFVAGATVTDNTVINPVAGISDTSGPYDKPFADPAAIYFDCVSGGITVTNNKFESINALLVGQAIMFGRSSSSAPATMSICSNSIITSDGSKGALANSSWARAYYDDPHILYSITFGDMAYPATGGRINDTFTLPYSVQPGNASFDFTGSRVQWLSCTGPSYGMATVQLDGNNVSTVDASVTRVALQNIDPNLGFCNQVLYDSGTIPFRDHTIRILVQGQPGSQSQNESTTIAVLGFAYVTGQDQCRDTPVTNTIVASFKSLFTSNGASSGPVIAPASTPVLAPSPCLSGMEPSHTLLSSSQLELSLGRAGLVAPVPSPLGAVSFSPGSAPYGAPGPQSKRQQFLPAAVSGK